MNRLLTISSIFALAWTASHAHAVDPAVLEAEAARVAVVERTKPPVVAVFGSDGAGGGSGVVISPDGFALTNFHVARPCGNAMKCGLPDGRVYDAVIVGIDPVGDVALIKLFGRDDFPTATIGDSDQVAVGDWAFVMGNPFLLAGDFQPTVTYGVISGVRRYQFPSGTLLEYADCLQTDASINPGNSGGPLFDADGRLIGIVGRASFEKRGRVNVGAGYAISINQVMNFLGHLKSGRIVDHATLGATVAFDEDGRVVVTDILQSSDAYRRGLRYDDEIVALAGRAIHTPNGLKNALGILPKGWRVPLSFRRGGERFDVLVRLEGVHADGQLAAKLADSSADPMPLPEPEPGKEDDQQDGPKERPAPGSPVMRPDKPKKPMPEIVKKHFAQRSGYANYYFNQTNRNRVLTGWLDRIYPNRQFGATWTLAGNTGTGSQFRLELTDAGVRLKLPESELQWTATDDLTETLAPTGSGGMLPALYLWRQLASQDPKEFGEVFYLGTAPLAGHEGLTDVIVALRGGVVCRCHFAADARLLAIEMVSDEAADPCEILFSQHREEDGRQIPGRIEIRHGDEQFALFDVDQFSTE